ncbi:MAG TPA: sensor histidine kinase [Actinomycetota bacterium]|nr:sensor histidine kinase [Actinomycetota bacterium]
MDTSMTPPPPPGQVPAANPLVRALRAPFEARTWKETIHLLLNMPFGIATFTIIVTGFALGFGMLITLVGIPILIGMLYVSRAMGTVERVRAGLLLDLDVPRPYRPEPPRDKWWRPFVSRATDPATWTEIVYHLLLLPVGVITFAVTFALWTTALALLFLPAYAWALPENAQIVDSWVRLTVDTAPNVVGVGLPGDGWVIDTPVEYALVSLIGFALVLLTPWVVRGLATGNRYLVRGMLGRDMTARVQELTASRSAAVDLAAEDRRRIERDLHDGVQQRLVSLAMDLGRAKEKLDTDPGRAKELVDDAHEEAKRAITEVRDLARGIHPAVLTDRGLDPALSALAARSPVPVDVSVDIAKRPPASTEAAAYFVVSEALANVAKHSKATKATVTVRRADDGWLTIQVQDDGVGGASIVDGSGLAGLRDRVGALDGELHLLSPEGGPTVLMVEIPCVS